LNTSTIHCDKLYTEYVRNYESWMIAVFDETDLDDPAFDEKYDAFAKCFTEEFHEDNYIDLLLFFDYLRERQHTEIEKENYRAMYIQLSNTITKKALKCSQKQ
jgi:hypothetical protein